MSLSPRRSSLVRCIYLLDAARLEASRSGAPREELARIEGALGAVTAEQLFRPERFIGAVVSPTLLQGLWGSIIAVLSSILVLFRQLQGQGVAV